MPADRPNILVILTDDQGYWALGCAGNDELRTPNLDRLSAGGVRLENFFCVSPVCSAARASLLTGTVPSRHGVHDWLRAGNSLAEPERDGRLIEYLRGQRTYTDALAEGGYTCGLSGKWHLGDAHHAQHGLAYWKAYLRAGGDYYGAPMLGDDGELYFEPRYVTDVITDNALAFLDAQAQGPSPFYLSVHYTAPHSPWYRQQHPPELFEPHFRDCPFRSAPDEPRHPDAGNTDFFDSPESRREKLAGYYAAITGLDAGVGRILERLEQLGLRENTLVLFTSDNGMNMGHHGICGKGNGTWPLNLYDTSVKVPGIVSGPGVAGGRVSGALLSHYDVYPTLLELAGLADADAAHRPGRSFADILAGAADAGRDDVVVFDEYGPARMVRTRDWKLVARSGQGPDQLFNLAEDPGERCDRIDDPAGRSALAELRQRLADWFARYADPAQDAARHGVTGRGQLGLAAGPDADGHPFATDWPGPWWREGFEPPPRP